MYYNTTVNKNIDQDTTLNKKATILNRLILKKNLIEDIVARLSTGEIKVQFELRGKTYYLESGSKQIVNLIDAYMEELSEIKNKLKEL